MKDEHYDMQWVDSDAAPKVLDVCINVKEH